MLQVANSSYYDYLRQKKQKANKRTRKRPGPKVRVDDTQLLAEVLDVIKTSPFTTEGTKKVHARLRRRGIKAARHRVNRLMREHGLLSPQRCEPGDPKKHDGTITLDAGSVSCSPSTA